MHVELLAQWLQNMSIHPVLTQSFLAVVTGHKGQYVESCVLQPKEIIHPSFPSLLFVPSLKYVYIYMCACVFTSLQLCVEVGCPIYMCVFLLLVNE